MAGGAGDFWNPYDDVLKLVPGTSGSTWTHLQNLPRPLWGAKASVVGGKMRITGGQVSLLENYYRTYRTEVREMGGGHNYPFFCFGHPSYPTKTLKTIKTIKTIQVLEYPIPARARSGLY